MKKLKVLLVDDSLSCRTIYKDAINDSKIAEVEDLAANGADAIKFLNSNRYDVVLLDVILPDINGIEILKIIKRNYPETEVIMISGAGKDNAVNTVKALDNGAFDFVEKPNAEIGEFDFRRFISKLQSLFTQINVKRVINLTSKNIVNTKKNDVQDKTMIERKPQKIGKPDVVVVASSTGGPVALRDLIYGMNNKLLVPMLIVQHMPKDFTGILADSLDKISDIPVIESKKGCVVEKGNIYLACGGLHTIVKQNSSNVILDLIDTPPVNHVKPAADVLFSSVAEVYKDKDVLAVVLTGMGSDGANGVRHLKSKCRCYCITQSESSCVVYGMPKSVEEAGLSDESLDMDKIAERVIKICSYGS